MIKNLQSQQFLSNENKATINNVMLFITVIVLPYYCVVGPIMEDKML